MDLKSKIRIIEGFPKDGISFKDITTLTSDGEAYKYTIDAFASHLKDKNVDVVVGPEARGFMFAAPLAYALGAAFVPVRKKENFHAKQLEKNILLNTVLMSLKYTKMQLRKDRRLL